MRTPFCVEIEGEKHTVYLNDNHYYVKYHGDIVDVTEVLNKRSGGETDYSLPQMFLEKHKKPH